MSTWVQTQTDQKKAVDEYNAYMSGRGGAIEEEFQNEMNKILWPSIRDCREMDEDEGRRVMELEKHPKYARHRTELRRLVLQMKWEDAKALRTAARRNEVFAVPSPGILTIDHDLPLSPFYKKPKENFYYNGNGR